MYARLHFLRPSVPQLHTPSVIISSRLSLPHKPSLPLNFYLFSSLYLPLHLQSLRLLAFVLPSPISFLQQAAQRKQFSTHCPRIQTMPGVAATPPPSVNSDFPARQTPPSPSTTSEATDTPKTPTISVIDEKVMNGKETRERRPPTSPASHRSKRAQHAAQHHQNHQHPGSLHYRQQNQQQYMRPYNSYSVHRHQALPEENDPVKLPLYAPYTKGKADS